MYSVIKLYLALTSTSSERLIVTTSQREIQHTENTETSTTIELTLETIWTQKRLLVRPCHQLNRAEARPLSHPCPGERVGLFTTSQVTNMCCPLSGTRTRTFRLSSWSPQYNVRSSSNIYKYNTK